MDIKPMRYRFLSWVRKFIDGGPQSLDQVIAFDNSASTRLFLSIFESAPIGIGFLDINSGQLKQVNRKVSEIFSLSQEEIKNINILESEHYAQLEVDEKALQALANNEVNEIKIFRKRQLSANVTIFLEIIISTINAESADSQLYLAIIEDHTRRVETDKKIIHLNANLENKIRLRTHDLEIAKQEAEEASHAKSYFLSNMSHEIRTPLNSIIGMSYLALKTDLDTKQQKYIDTIRASGEHMLALVDDILDISKIEAGILGLDNQPFMLSQIRDNLDEVLSGLIQDNDIELVIDFPEYNDYSLIGDNKRISQVLINLVGNAIKFTPSGKIHISAKIQDESETQCVTYFEVTDTGIGISESQMPHLFNLFQQADPTITRKYGGAGLGLAISKQIIEHCGGEIGVDSQIAEGSTFWFTVPLEKGEKIDLPEHTQKISNKDVKKCIEGANILLVEDNVFNQQVAADLLELAGALVMIANNGREALEMVKQFNFDCILMDIQMPEMGGIEATRLIRKDPEISDIKIIAMTASASQLNKESCLAAGMNDYVSKPIKPDLLYDLVARTICFHHSYEGAKRTAEASRPVDTVVVDSETAAININDYKKSDKIQSSLFSIETLADYVGDDKETLVKFTYRFIESAEAAVSEMQQAINDGDLLALSEVAHRIKSAAVTVGAIELSEHCIEMEKLKQDGTVDAAQAIYTDVLTVFDATKKEIDQQLGLLSYEDPAILDSPIDPQQSLDLIKVLVVDDEQFHLDFAKNTLNTLGIEHITTATDGGEGLKKFHEDDHPELIICDLHMPWMNGVELLKSIAAFNYKGRIVLLTGTEQSQLSAAELLAKQYGLNVVGAMRKPLKKPELKKIIDDIALNMENL